MKIKQKRRITLIAVAKESALHQTKDRDELIAQVHKKLEHITAPHAIQCNLHQTLVQCPWEWPAPDDLGQPDLLGAHTWNKICLHLCNTFGDFKYRPKRLKPAHLIIDDGEVALFQVTLKV